MTGSEVEVEADQFIAELITLERIRSLSLKVGNRRNQITNPGDLIQDHPEKCRIKDRVTALEVVLLGADHVAHIQEAVPDRILQGTKEKKILVHTVP